MEKIKDYLALAFLATLTFLLLIFSVVSIHGNLQAMAIIILAVAYFSFCVWSGLRIGDWLVRRKKQKALRDAYRRDAESSNW